MSADDARAEEPLRIWWNKNLHGKISKEKLAAHAAHAALHAYGIEYTHPIVVLSAGKAKIEAMPIAIRDEGRTELAPGTLTTGVEKSWQVSRPFTEEDVEAVAKAMDENFNPDRYPIMSAMFKDYARAALDAVTARHTKGDGA